MRTLIPCLLACSLFSLGAFAGHAHVFEPVVIVAEPAATLAWPSWRDLLLVLTVGALPLFFTLGLHLGRRWRWRDPSAGLRPEW